MEGIGSRGGQEEVGEEEEKEVEKINRKGRQKSGSKRRSIRTISPRLSMASMHFLMK